MTGRIEPIPRIEKGSPCEVFNLDKLSLSSSDRRRRMLSPSCSNADEALRIALCWSTVRQEDTIQSVAVV